MLLLLPALKIEHISHKASGRRHPILLLPRPTVHNTSREPPRNRVRSVYPGQERVTNEYTTGPLCPAWVDLRADAPSESRAGDNEVNMPPA